MFFNKLKEINAYSNEHPDAQKTEQKPSDGGTAAQFTHDQRDSVAMVASQDRRFTVFGWSPCEETVLAHRIDALLM